MKNAVFKVVIWCIVCCTAVVHSGVVVEGSASGIEDINTVKYLPENNSFIINNSSVINNPVSCDELIELIDAVNLDERVGVSVTLSDNLIVYGKLHKRSETAEKLEDADNFIRSVVFAEYSRLRKYTLPQDYKPVVVKSRERSSVIYLQLSDFNFTNKDGKYVPNSLEANIMLIPMATYTAPDGGYLPDYDALEKGIFQSEDKANADHINTYKNEYLKLPPLREAMKIGQAAAFVRLLRDSGINLSELSRSLIEGDSIALIGKKVQESVAESAGEDAAVITEENNAKAENEIIAESEFADFEIPVIEENPVTNNNIDYAENIRQIFLIDTVIGNTGKVKLSRESVNDGSYVEYRANYIKSIKNPDNINLDETPEDFKIAFNNHIKAWEKALVWLKDKKIAAGENSFTAFYEEHGKYRNELQDSYNQCKEIARKYQVKN